MLFLYEQSPLLGRSHNLSAPSAPPTLALTAPPTLTPTAPTAFAPTAPPTPPFGPSSPCSSPEAEKLKVVR